MNRVLSFLAALMTTATLQAQKVEYPDISYAGTPRVCEIGGINVTGVKDYEDYVLAGLSGLSVGQTISIPGAEITDAVKRYWRHGLFSDVSISIDSIKGSKAYLRISLSLRPRVSSIRYNGVKKSEREDLQTKLGIMEGSQITPNMIDRAKILAKKYFEDKGYKNAEINITEEEDISQANKVILNVDIDKNEKMKVRSIILEGNKNLSDKKIKGTLYKPSVLKKIHEAGKLSNIFKTTKKFTQERWDEAKENLIGKYNELGFRDAEITDDSVWNVDSKHVNVFIKVNEGRKYFIRNITWVGNTVYTSDFLDRVLGMKKGDVYNQKEMGKRLSEDDDAVGNLYWNNGYLFYNLDPVEVNIVDDSVDLEMRITENNRAYISHVRIYGNNRLYEEVVRRELRVKPGDLFSKDALMRSAREIASMGYFDETKVEPDIQPNYNDGTVDINWPLEQKSNDQLSLSLGWGQTGIIGKIGITLNNFSIRNLIGKNKMHRGFMPIGDGESLTLNFSTNADYYRTWQFGYTKPWFGGKRPNALTAGFSFSKMTGVSSSYYNSGYMSNYYNYLYGSSYSYNNYYNSYENYYDPDQFVKIFTGQIGWGMRLRWPDDYFNLMLSLAYTRYSLKNWQYFIMTNGDANNLNFNIQLSRTSTDNQLYPRRGSEFLASLSITPPYSAWDGKDYASLANDNTSATYNAEQQVKYRWIEYHKWKFKLNTFTALTSAQKCFVLRTRLEIGILGSYDRHKKSPFETFYVGGDGMSGYSTGYAEETIGLRGYENGSLTPYGYEGYAYDRFTLELRYPFMLGQTTIYGLAFLEGGNAWNDVNDINPFDLKRSAGAGVRINLPMVGFMGIDWAYGFDKVFGSTSYGGSHFHFILGQEF